MHTCCGSSTTLLTSGEVRMLTSRWLKGAICRSISLIALLCAVISSWTTVASCQNSQRRSSTFSATSVAGLELLNGQGEIVSYRGRSAVHLIPSPKHQGPEDSVIAILRDSDFGEGSIEAVVAGVPRKDAPADSRGFIGISFHVQRHASQFENIYLRPTNGRAEDQLRRNHSVQYTSEPEFPWFRL